MRALASAAHKRMSWASLLFSSFSAAFLLARSCAFSLVLGLGVSLGFNEPSARNPNQNTRTANNVELIRFFVSCINAFAARTKRGSLSMEPSDRCWTGRRGMGVGRKRTNEKTNEEACGQKKQSLRLCPLADVLSTAAM